MVAKLNAFLFILLYLFSGALLILLPWVQLQVPFSDGNKMFEWGENKFLSYLSHALGSPFLENLIASGWVRGAVTGFGVFLVFLAFWEILHFQQAAAQLENETAGR